MSRATPVVEGEQELRWTWVDLRLIPVAATVWCVSLPAPLIPPVGLAVAAVAAVAAAALAAALGRRPAARSALVLAVLAGVAVTAGTAAVRGAARESSPLRAVAEAGRAAAVVLEVDGDPHVLTGPGPPRIVADASVTALVDGGVSHRLRAAALLFAPAEEWRALLPGQRVRVRVGTSLPQDADDLVAVLSARGPPTLVGEPGTLQQVAGGLRAALSAAAGRVLEPRPAGLLPGLVVGDTGAMDPVLEQDFRRAGLAHLTAVSGVSVD
jgi:competence protein ComEC